LQKLFLLGSTSFVGKNLVVELSKHYEVIEFSRPYFDFLDPISYSTIDFSKSIIVDCINVNNGNMNDIENCNSNGFRLFLDNIIQHHKQTKYIYFSTISVISDEIVSQNNYVKSKLLAEDYLKESGILHHIIRLSYPIGKGENKLRLTSRLIKDIKNKERITISDIKINLTPVKCLAENIFQLTQFEENKTTFFSNNVYISLQDFVETIGELLSIKPNYIINKSETHFEPISENPIGCDVKLLDCLKEMI
jgi:dTDP-4-dehydrorhamnose reductase